ncbi:hypothetical protein [Crocosphaera sp. Alani8]|uniref:hypothetical protein n=1 Tax=Crocosphaera sp. Alani8 TaxID=3038952 RepID=UPI00313ACD94
MRVLFDVVKTLLLINGVAVIPSLVLVTAAYRQHSSISTASANEVPSKFYRSVQDDTSAFKQKLDELEVEKDQLEAKLEAAQRTMATAVAATKPEILARNPVVLSTVSALPEDTSRTDPAVKIPPSAKKIKRSEVKPSSRLKPKVPISSPVRNAVIPPTEKEEALTVPGTVNLTNPIKPNSDGSSEQSGKADPKGFIKPQDLGTVHAKANEIPGVAPQPTTPIDEHIILANDLSAGLIDADIRKELTHGTGKYKKVQTAIRSLRKGSSESLEEASQLSGIDLETLQWLVKYGQDRPGRFGLPLLSRRPSR